MSKSEILKEKRIVSPLKPTGYSTNVADGLVNRQPNWFAIVKKDRKSRLELGGWKNCREDFHKAWKKQRMLIFSHGKGINGGPNTSHSIAVFIRMAEDKIRGEGRGARSQVGPTEYLNLSWIKVSKWWSNEKMRKSFFSILLRAARHFDSRASDLEKEFESALFKDDQGYFKKTKPAVRRFMKGHTKYKGKKSMWLTAMWLDTCSYNTMKTDVKPVSGDRLKKLLVRP